MISEDAIENVEVVSGSMDDSVGFLPSQIGHLNVDDDVAIARRRMQKVIKDAIIDLNIEPSRLFLSCRSCHGLKPMIIVELDDSHQCKLCATIGKSILLYEQVSCINSDQTFVEYTVVREHKSSWIDKNCKYVGAEQFETCRYGSSCKYVHNAMERKLWKIGEKHNVDWTAIVEAIAKLFSQDETSAWFHCPICSVNLTTGLEFSAHCDTKQHKALSKEWRPKGINWKFRDPPNLDPRTKEFTLCRCVEKDEECEQEDQCPYAHSEDELEEWNRRLIMIKEKLKFTKENALMSFADQIAEEYAECDSPASVLAENIDGVKCTLSRNSEGQRCTKHSKFVWDVKLECDDPQKKLSHVAFLQRSGDYFKVSCVRGKHTSEPTTHIDFTAATDDRNNLSQGKAKFRVKFLSHDCGSFVDCLVIEFRDTPRPVLMIKFQIEVNLKDSINLDAIKVNRPEKVTDDWEKTRIVVRYNEDDDRSNETIARLSRLSVDYKPPSVALDRKQSSNEDGSVEFQSKELTAENYVARMHEVLYKEEEARSKAMSKLHCKCDIGISENFFSSFSGLRMRDQQKGNLFGIFELPNYLDRDSDEGLLVLESCTKVLLSHDSLGPKADVFEAKIEETSSDHMVLNLSAECVQRWRLKTGMLIPCEIRFLLDRRILCMCHCALDLLGDRVSILCPDERSAENFRVLPTWNNNSCPIDSDQMKALQHMMSDQPPLPLFALLGPFGTGKTYAIGVCVEYLLQHDQTAKVLICTHSNSAADLYIEYNFQDPSWQGKIIRVYYHGRKTFTVAEEVKQHCLFDGRNQFRYPEAGDILSGNVKVVITTFSTALVLGQKGTGLQGVFTHIFLDEGAQALEAEAIIPLTLAVTNKTKVVVAGDHLQISPKVFSKQFGSETKFTLVERIYAKYKEFKASQAYKQDQLCVFLRNNYRCIKPILDLIQEAFYKRGLLKSCSKEASLPGVYPVQFIHVQGECEKDPSTGGFFNRMEAQVTVEIATDLFKNHSVEQSDIAVVSTYAVQVKLIRDFMRKNKLRNVDVERTRNIQGREYKVVIISCVHRRTSKEDTRGENFGFLADVGLLNTAITRSKIAVLAVGDAVTLCSLGQCQHRWNVFLNTCFRSGTIRRDNNLYHEIRRQITELSALNPEARKFVPRSRPKAKARPVRENRPVKEIVLPTVIDERSLHNSTPADQVSPPESNEAEAADEVESDTDTDNEDTPLVDDDILNDILRKELGAETEGIRMRVDEEGLEYLEAEDPNEIRQDYTKGSRTLRAFGRRYQNRKRLHYKFTVSQLFDLLRTEPDRYKRCLLDVKWWHTAEAILKQPENGLTKILLPSKNSIGHAFDKDEVVVQISNPMIAYDPTMSVTGKVIGVLTRYKDPRTREFVCIPDRFNPSNQMCPVDNKTTKFFLFSLKNRKQDEIQILKFNKQDKEFRRVRSVRVDRNNVHGYGKLFIVRYLFWNDHCAYPLGYVCDVIKTSEGEKYYSITYDVPPQHNKGMEDDAEKLVDTNDNMREDFTHLYTFTIDPPQSTDLDDAISIEKCPRKNHEDCYRIGVHIADVASVLPENSKVDLEAKKRGTTFYVPETARNENRTNSPMLPRSLSSNKCSLLPGETRPTISMFFHTTRPPALAKNRNKSEDSLPVPRLTKIRSRHQLTYRQAAQFLLDGKLKLVKDFDVSEDKTLPQQMYQVWQFVLKLRQTRLGTAMLYGEPDFDKYHEFCEEGLAHMLIEEAMITLNACSAIFMKNKHCNFLLRCQDPPLDDEWMLWKRRYAKQIRLSLRQLSCLDYLKRSDNPDEAELANEWQRIEVYKYVWDDIRKAMQRKDLESALLLFCCDLLQPSLAPAARGFMKIQKRATLKPYTVQEHDLFSHFSLRLPFYSWCSSPIRRYPDIIAQRAMIKKIKHAMVNPASDNVIVLDTQEDEQNLKPICKLIAQRQNDAKDYEKGMNGFALAALLQNHEERSYMQVIVTEITSKEVSFTSVALKNLQHILKPVKYRDLMAKKSKPVLERDVPPAHGQKVLKENTLTWHLKYYYENHDVHKTATISKFWVRFEVGSQRWLPLISALTAQWNESGVMDDVHHNYVERCLDDVACSRKSFLKCPRRSHKDVGPCDRPNCNQKTSTCPDFMSFRTKNNIKHGRVVSLDIKPGNSILIQLYPAIHRGLLQPCVQLLCIAKDIEICVEHQSAAVETFAADARPNPLPETHRTLKHYVESWLPLLRLEGVFCAVADRSSATISGVRINWDEEKRSGEFKLKQSFCDNRLLGIHANDFLCIRVHGVRSKTEAKLYTWVAHAVVTESGTEEEVRNKKKPPATRQRGDKDVNMLFVFKLCQPVPPFKIPVPNAEVQSKLATVECLQLSVPFRRMARTLTRIRDDEGLPRIVESLCLGLDLVLEITSTRKEAAMEVMKTVGKGTLRGFKYPLNDGQVEQIAQAMMSRISLIQGPPGTGKSVVGAHLVYYFHQVNLRLGSNRKIIYCGPSNKSVDVAAGYLLDCGLKILRVYGKMIEELAYPNPLKPRLGHRTQEKPSQRLKSTALHEKIRQPTNKHHAKIKEYDKKFSDANRDVRLKEYLAYADVVNSAKEEELSKHDIIVCTCTTAAGHLLRELHYSHCIIDEAAMCSEPETMVPVLTSCANQIVLIGDHKQLQPVIQCPKAKELGLLYSKFERLHEHAGMLKRQYRMNESICDFPSMQFYEGKLVTDDSVRDVRGVLRYPIDSRNSAVFAHIEGEEDSSRFDHGGENSYYNQLEAEAVIFILRWLHFFWKVELHNIMILSPYSAQCEIIKKEIQESRSQLTDVHVGTVVTSQGSERDYVILSTVRSRKFNPNDEMPSTLHWKRKYLGFVTDPHQINVAITRARKGLCIVGNKKILSKDTTTWEKLLERYDEQGSVVDFNDADAPWNQR